ncbi:MAG TPA: M1 family metallopeptidase [Actinoplanes sp.]|nr:M1 family metallopeptidase [Actinoplanes sp.]
MVRRAALVITAVLSTVLAGTPAVAAGGGTPGAAGVGDPYFPNDGNGGYDVRHYGLAITYTPETDVLAGRATIRARATQHLSAFNLDFEGLTIRSITVDGRPARWTRNGGELTVTPRRTLRNGHTFVTRVVYDGIPQTIIDPVLGDAGVFHTDDGVVIIGQPDVAATWFPANDHPIDKASYDIDITVPTGLEALSNGVLEGRSSRNGWTTWRWHAREPMATYLATATVGQFDLTSYRVGGIRYIDALDPALPPEVYDIAAASLAREPEIVEFLSEYFGRYPFNASGGIVDSSDAWGFALENQTRPIYAPGFFDSQESGESVVVHELAHMWYGDSVALARWSDIWLNEGLASYAEWMWSEAQGRGTAQEIFDENYARPADAAFWRLRIGDPGPANLFAGAVYDRGAMTIHALRLAVGDATFFRILRSWAQRNKGGNVTTAQFIAHAERVSGQQLDALFDAWLFTPSKPAAPTP